MEEWIPIIKKMWIKEFIKLRDKYFEDLALGRTNSHPEKPKLPMKKYEIWIGTYHLGQGDHPPNNPQKVGEIEASSFRIACCIYEHQRSIDSLKDRMERNDGYIEDCHFGKWNYNPETNSNSWLGKYYESYEEALKSFK